MVQLPLRRIYTTTNRTMELTGQTYSYYFTREHLPPIIFFVLCVAVTLLLIPVQLLLNRSPKLNRHFKTQFLIKLVFSTMLNRQTDRAGKNVYTILNYKVPERYKVLMLAIVLSLIGIAALVFWNTFLFEESHICGTDPYLACFPAYPSMSTPRLDCSDTSYLKDNNITSIICFRYAYRVSAATGSALGIITFDALFIIIINLLLLKVSNGSGWSKRRAVLTVAIQITIVALIAVYLGIQSYLFPTLESYTIEKKITTLMINGFVTYTIFYSTVLFPWWSFKKIKNDEYDKEEDNKENDEDNGGNRRARGTSIPIMSRTRSL